MHTLKPTELLLIIIIAAVPFLAGFTQPMIPGIVFTATIIASGIWLIFNYEQLFTQKLSYRPLLYLFILAALVMTTVSLPIELIKSISPARAQSLFIASQNGQEQVITTSLSYNIAGTQMFAIYGLTLFLLFYFSSSRLTLAHIQHPILWLITIVGVVEALIGIIGFASSTSESIGLKGTFPNHDQYAIFLNLCWPLSFVFGISQLQGIIRTTQNKKINLHDWAKLVIDRSVLPLWCTAIIIVSILLSQSFTGISVLLLLVILFCLALPFPRNIKALIPITTGVILLIFSFVTSGVQGIISFVTGIIPSIQTTFNVWANSIVILQEHIYTGIGMNAYKLMSPVYPPIASQNLPLKNIGNDYLQLILEMGLPLALLLLVWLISCLVTYGKAALHKPSTIRDISQNKIIAAGAFFALTGLLLSGLGKSTFHVPAITFYAACIIGIMHKYTHYSANSSKPRGSGELHQQENNKGYFVPYLNKNLDSAGK